MITTEKYSSPPCDLTEFTWDCDCDLRKCDKCLHNYSCKVEKKMDFDWMPENPYDPKVNLDGYYGFNHGWIAGQKKLLEYQLAKAKAMKVGTVRTELGLWIESMLERLEEK